MSPLRMTQLLKATVLSRPRRLLPSRLLTLTSGGDPVRVGGITVTGVGLDGGEIAGTTSSGLGHRGIPTRLYRPRETSQGRSRAPLHGMGAEIGTDNSTGGAAAPALRMQRTRRPVPLQGRALRWQVSRSVLFDSGEHRGSVAVMENTTASWNWSQSPCGQGGYNYKGLQR